MAANVYSAMLALSDSSDNKRQQLVGKGKRFTNAYSKLKAYRHPLDDQNLKHIFDPFGKS